NAPLTWPTFETRRVPERVNANPNGFGSTLAVRSACSRVSEPFGLTVNVSIAPTVLGTPRRVTTNWWPSGLKPICAATPPAFGGAVPDGNPGERSCWDPGIDHRRPSPEK